MVVFASLLKESAFTESVGNSKFTPFFLASLISCLAKTTFSFSTKEFPAVFTVQEEIGIRGANVSSMDINPDFGFGLDTTIAWDTPGSTKQEQVSALGEGAWKKE